MKQIASILLATIFFTCHRVPPVKTGLEGKSLPSFDFLLMDSTSFNSNNIPSGKPIVLFYLSPTCPYCRAEIKEIQTNIASLQNFRIYILTTASISVMKDFYSKYHLNNYPNINVAIDNSFEFGSYFNIKTVPFNAIYTSQKKLNSVIPGKAVAKDFEKLEQLN